MPGLLRGMARTAVVAGTAAHVAGNVQHRQQTRWAQQDAEAQAEQPQKNQPTYGETVSPDTTDQQISQLEKLSELKDQGVLTQAEFDAKKREILGT